MAGTQAARRMADRLMDGKLEETVTHYRRAGTGWAPLSRYLNSEYGVEVTPETLQQWVPDRETETAS